MKVSTPVSGQASQWATQLVGNPVSGKDRDRVDPVQERNGGMLEEPADAREQP